MFPPRLPDTCIPILGFSKTGISARSVDRQNTRSHPSFGPGNEATPNGYSRPEPLLAGVANRAAQAIPIECAAVSFNQFFRQCDVGPIRESRGGALPKESYSLKNLIHFGQLPWAVRAPAKRQDGAAAYTESVPESRIEGPSKEGAEAYKIPGEGLTAALLKREGLGEVEAAQVLSKLHIGSALADLEASREELEAAQAALSNLDVTSVLAAGKIAAWAALSNLDVITTLVDEALPEKVADLLSRTSFVAADKAIKARFQALQARRVAELAPHREPSEPQVESHPSLGTVVAQHWISTHFPAAQISEVTKIAQRIFGDEGTALTWLREPNLATDNQPPIDLLGTSGGFSRVRDLLLRIEFGVLA